MHGGQSNAVDENMRSEDGRSCSREVRHLSRETGSLRPPNPPVLSACTELADI